MKFFFRSIIGFVLTSRAKSFLKKHRTQIIAITGSVGKTSTKEAIYTLLKSKFDVATGKKGFNTEIGLSLAVLQEDESGFTSASAWLGILKRAFFEKKIVHKKLILEMGADKPGDLRKLIKIAPPVIAVITNVNPVHLAKGQFRNIDEIAKEKSTLVRHLPKSGLAILNADDPRVQSMETPAGKLTYGVNNDAMLMAGNISASSKMLKFSVAYRGHSHAFEVPVIGEFQIYVLLPAIAVGLSMGMTLAECAEALKNLKTPQGRMNHIAGRNQSHIIDSSYNSSPTTVIAALNVLGGLRAKRKISALGMMNELGDMSYEAHITMGEKAAQVSDIIFAVGKEAPTIKKGAMSVGMKEENIFTFFDSRDAGLALADKLESGDLVLVKGSQNMVRMERLVKEIMKEPDKASELLCRQGEAWEKR